MRDHDPHADAAPGRALAPIGGPPAAAVRGRAIPALSPEAAAYAASAYAPATIGAYASDCKHFTAWCAREGRIAIPADLDTVASYIAAHGAELGRATLSRRLVGIGFAHRAASLPWVGTHPLIKATLRGVLRQHCRFSFPNAVCPSVQH